MLLTALVYSLFVAFVCCMLLHPKTSLWTRLARVHLTSPPTPSRAPSAYVQARRASMLRKAVNAHASTNTTGSTNSENSSSKDSTLPSSRNALSSFKPPTQYQPLQPSSSSAYNQGITHGIKRNAAGIAKSLYSNKTNGFQDTSSADISRQSKYALGSTSEQAAVSFTEDDFDDDIELEMEEPRAKKIYPTLPVTKRSPMRYPDAQKASFHTQARSNAQVAGTTDSLDNSSSHPLPWSSSPAEHFGAPAKQLSPSKRGNSRNDAIELDSTPPAKRPRTSQRYLFLFLFILFYLLNLLFSFSLFPGPHPLQHPFGVICASALSLPLSLSHTHTLSLAIDYLSTAP